MPDWTSVLFTGSPAVASLLTSSPNTVKVTNTAGHVVAQTSLTAVKTVSIGTSGCLASVVTSVCFCLLSISPLSSVQRCGPLSCCYMHTCTCTFSWVVVCMFGFSLSLTYLSVSASLSPPPLPQAHATTPTAAAPRSRATTMESAIRRVRVSASARAGGRRSGAARRSGRPAGRGAE